jgi:hypothetical protein
MPNFDSCTNAVRTRQLTRGRLNGGRHIEQRRSWVRSADFSEKISRRSEALT